MPAPTSPIPTPPDAILLVEDDAPSRLFLATALEQASRTVIAVDGIEAALAARRQRRFGLYVIDQQLGHGPCDGPALLAQLRALDRTDGQPPTAALGLSADLDADALRAAGFDAALAKPLPAERLRSTAARLLGPALPAHGTSAGTPADDDGPVWSDADALPAVGGRLAILQQLRTLLRDELPGMRVQIAEALDRGDPQAARDVLHRLKASTAFCGANALANATARLSVTLADGRPHDAARVAFERACAALLAD